MKIESYRIGFLGFGHMAKIIFRAIERSKLIPRSQMLFSRKDPHKARADEQDFKISSTTLETLVSQSDLIFLCVRPAQVNQVLAAVASCEIRGKMILSILAGIRIAYFEKILNNVPLIRAMPNVASEVGEGMTIISPGIHAHLEFRSLINLLFKSMGRVVELSENFLDIATGMAGSGPAFVMALIEAMARLGETHGISYEKARAIAAQTFFGAAKMILQCSGSIHECIDKIAVPNGTTEAGLNMFKQLEVDKQFQQVIETAAQRSKDIVTGI